MAHVPPLTVTVLLHIVPIPAMDTVAPTLYRPALAVVTVTVDLLYGARPTNEAPLVFPLKNQLMLGAERLLDTV